MERSVMKKHRPTKSIAQLISHGSGTGALPVMEKPTYAFVIPNFVCSEPVNVPLRFTSRSRYNREHCLRSGVAEVNTPRSSRSSSWTRCCR